MRRFPSFSRPQMRLFDFFACAHRADSSDLPTAAGQKHCGPDESRQIISARAHQASDCSDCSVGNPVVEQQG
jgi:hypothetical protein